MHLSNYKMALGLEDDLNEIIRIGYVNGRIANGRGSVNYKQGREG